MNDFSVGDRVYCYKKYAGNCDIIGKTGTILYIWSRNTIPSVCIGFDIPINGHTSHGSNKNSAWNIPIEGYIKLISSKTVLTKQQKIENKCKKLWNTSNYVKHNPHLAY